MTACDSGESAAPNMPCSNRNRIICSRESAAPHIAEVIVKPAMLTTKKFLRPKREASQPTGAVMIAAATM